MLPRILQFGKFYPPDIGGIESVMQDICEGLNARGLICDVLCSNSARSFAYDITKSARIYRTASFGKVASTSISPQMISALSHLIAPYHIIHLHLPDPMANLALFLLQKKARGKIIILHWHSDIIKQKYLLRFYKPLQTWLLKRADFIIATSPNYIAQSRFLKPFRQKCISIPIGINAHLLKPPCAHTQHLDFLDKYAHKKMIFSLGRLAQNKGFVYLIESMKFLSQEYILCIGGDGALRNELKRLIGAANLTHRVFLVGAIPREQLAYYYERCHIFVLPSIQESFGVVLLEAMSFSKPVISTNLSPSGSAFVNQHGISGLVIPPKNPKAIAQAINDIESRYAHFAKGARERFLAHFTQEQMLDSIIALYKRAYELRKGGGRSEYVALYAPTRYIAAHFCYAYNILAHATAIHSAQRLTLCA
ncbi:glycosyltransferase [Helicobacter jaachi]|uniref:Glycosyltransferase n=1 Tax=Helicobacter jaachi TaxID=1677920 RepID=A0A4U8TAJ5_9HELI|nr:glycosyltransferase [Helicobacter jaachi]TLD96859.1 glycosyltransferase [Helicobacter jaachi]